MGGYKKPFPIGIYYGIMTILVKLATKQPKWVFAWTKLRECDGDYMWIAMGLNQEFSGSSFLFLLIF